MSFQQSEKLTSPTTAKQLLETYNYTIKKCNFNIVMINFMLRIYKTESHWRLVKKKIFHLAVSSHYFGGRQITFWFSIPRIICLYLRVYVSGTMKLSVSNEWVKVGL